MKRFHHPLHRRGMTLVEVLLTITASTMVVGVAGGLLHRALRLEAASRGALQGERTALVLARQVRADIRAARTVACTADGLPADVVLRVQPAGEAAIVYRAVRGGLVREQAIPANRIAREAFSFPAAVRFESVRGDVVPHEPLQHRSGSARGQLEVLTVFAHVVSVPVHAETLDLGARLQRVR